MSLGIVEGKYSIHSQTDKGRRLGMGVNWGMGCATGTVERERETGGKMLPEMCLTKFFRCDHSSSITVDGPLGSHMRMVGWLTDDVTRGGWWSGRNKHGQSREEVHFIIWTLFVQSAAE